MRYKPLMVIAAISILLLLPYIGNVYAQPSPETYIGTAHIHTLSVTPGHIYYSFTTMDMWMNVTEGWFIIDNSPEFHIVYMSNNSGYIHLIGINIEESHGVYYREIISVYFKVNGPFNFYDTYFEYNSSGIIYSDIYMAWGYITYED